MAILIINSKRYGKKEVIFDDCYENLLNRYIWHVVDDGIHQNFKEE